MYIFISSERVHTLKYDNRIKKGNIFTRIKYKNHTLSFYITSTAESYMVLGIIPADVSQKYYHTSIESKVFLYIS